MKNNAVIFSSPFRGEVAERSEAGGGECVSINAPSLILPPKGGGNSKPFAKGTQLKAKKLRNNLTEAEKKLWYFLRNKQMGVRFRRQQPFGPYIADFISFEAKLIIEADGGQHSENGYDALRDAYIRGQGYQIMRFWNNEIMENIEGVLQRITTHLRHPLLTSPLKEEELMGKSV